MYTVGKDGERIIILTDLATECAGLTKVDLSPEEAEGLVRQMAFALNLTLPFVAAPAWGYEGRSNAAARTPLSTIPAPAVDEEAPAMNAVEEARQADERAIAERALAAERKRATEEARELRRINALGSRGATGDDE